MDIQLNFQKAVAKCLINKRMTQLDLSVMTGISPGISQSSIYRYLAGKRSPSLAQVEVIANALEISSIALMAYPHQVAILEKLL